MNTLDSSATPLGARLSAVCCSMMNSALHNTASVSAICSAISVAPTLLRRREDRIGPSSMMSLPPYSVLSCNAG
jgi:hypothetical protein